MSHQIYNINKETEIIQMEVHSIKRKTLDSLS